MPWDNNDDCDDYDDVIDNDILNSDGYLKNQYFADGKCFNNYEENGYYKSDYFRGKACIAQRAKRKIYPPYIHSHLAITNISSKNELPLGLSDTLDKIITRGDIPQNLDSQDYGISAWDFENKKIFYWMSLLKKYIPIFLVDEDYMPDVQVKIKIKNPEIKRGEQEIISKKSSEIENWDRFGYCPPVETLGCYFPSYPIHIPNINSKKDNTQLNLFPIYLCPARIERAAKDCLQDRGVKSPIELMYAIVLIHELAHAVMDETNVPDRQDFSKIDIPKNKKSYNFEEDDDLVEECLADVIMLKYLKRYYGKHSKEYSAARKFVRNQPEGYNWALNNESTSGLWQEWRKYKSNSNCYSRPVIVKSNQFTVHMMIGIPGAGKSTWAQKSLPNVEIISRDGIRDGLLLDDPNLASGQIDQRVSEKEEEKISSCCQNKDDFILDNMNLDYNRDSIIERLRKAGACVIAVYMDTPLKVCKKRRKGYITPKQMNDVSKKLVPPELSEFDEIIHVKYNEDEVLQ